MNIQTKTNNEGIKLISCDYIQYGDYDNSCAVERANVRYLKEQKLIIELEKESYGFEKAWILDNEENNELINSLENYPCFNDELLNEIEMEIELEYIKDNDDIYRLYTEKDLKDVLYKLDLTSIIPEIYYKAKENCNVEFIVESGGNGYIDLEKIANEYNLLLCNKYSYIKTFSEIQEIINKKPVFPINFYDNAEDCNEHKKSTFSNYTNEEMQQIIEYTIELENLINKLEI